MKLGHLERVKMRLRTLAPLFIGSGESLTKKEYIFNKRRGLIFLPDLPKLITFLKSRDLLNQFENFLIDPRKNDLWSFLNNQNIKERDYPDFINYHIEAGEAATSEHFRNVLTFIKGADGRPYIPGSSVKGALRTAIAGKLLQKGDWNYQKTNIERESNNYRGSKRYLDQDSKNIEKSLFYKLNIKDQSNKERNVSGPVNDFMRGIQISDSLPLDYELLTLTGKYDRKPDGSFKLLPIFRECLIPGSEAHFSLTLDLPILVKAGIDLNFIEDALHSFSNAYYDNFEQTFKELPEDADQGAKEGVTIILGSGAGYPSKTITYNLFSDRNRSLPLVSKILTKQFPTHKHHLDQDVFKASPHILKTTFYQGQYYQMGRCELIFN